MSDVEPSRPPRRRRRRGQSIQVEPDIRVGFVLSPAFTLLPFAGFVDTLRHSADEGDRSRQIHCKWTILGANLEPVRASCGAEVTPWQTYDDPAEFDYVVVVGGLTSAFGRHAPETFDFLRAAEARRMPVVGLCTGSFAMAECGLLDGKRCAVHARHREEFTARYPAAVVTDDVYVFDGNAITCPGGTAAIDVAVELVKRHSGKARAFKGLPEMLVAEHRTAVYKLAMPHEHLMSCGDWRVEQAVQLMQGSLAEPTSVQRLARKLGTSVSQLDRCFVRQTGMPAAALWREMRLLHARWLLLNSDRSVSYIAQECGFADSSHLNRLFRREFGEAPGELRRNRDIHDPGGNE